MTGKEWKWIIGVASVLVALAVILLLVLSGARIDWGGVQFRRGVNF